MFGQTLFKDLNPGASALQTATRALHGSVSSVMAHMHTTFGANMFSLLKSMGQTVISDSSNTDISTSQDSNPNSLHDTQSNDHTATYRDWLQRAGRFEYRMDKHRFRTRIVTLALRTAMQTLKHTISPDDAPQHQV